MTSVRPKPDLGSLGLGLRRPAVYELVKEDCTETTGDKGTTRPLAPIHDFTVSYIERGCEEPSFENFFYA